MRSRSTLVAAKSQQRPLAFWLVTSSVGTSTENFWRMAPRTLGAEGDAVQLALGEGECGEAALGAGLIVRAEALKQGRSNRFHR